MKLHANGLSHLGLRVTNLARAKRFYVDTLGCQLVREIDGAVLVNVYGTLISLYGADSHSSSNDHHGVEEDLETHDKYISFYDPDGIAWELYSVSTHPDV